MSSGSLGGMAISQHIPTPQVHADRLRHLVSFAAGQRYTVGDLNGCGAGNLLAAFNELPNVQLFGIEISAERAEQARLRLPLATIVRAPFEATRPTPDSFSLCVTNPPYVRLDDGRRAEYAAQVLVTRALAPGGVSIAVIPARSGLDGTLINHWTRHYHSIRCWKFPHGDPDDDTSFQKYTQIVVAGVKRDIPFDEPDLALKSLMLGWRYASETQTWAGGTPPPDLPDTPIAEPYSLPVAACTPQITVLHADDGVLLDGLSISGVQHTPLWHEAVSLVSGGILAPPLMPPTGPAHLAALILSGLLDGEILTGPNGESFVITTATSKQATHMPIDDDLRQKGVVHVAQIEDNPLLGVLNLESGEIQNYQNDEAFAFLQPLLPVLAAQVLERHRPLYKLDPDDWELHVVAQIGLDKQLPGAEFPGLAPAQMHRVFALRRALWSNRRAMMQGEPGVGKTRQLAALIATLAHFWQERATTFRSQRQPGWARRLKKAWKACRHTRGQAPQALPIWIAPPKRVIPTWRRELAGAFPSAEVMVIREHIDVDRWMARCAESDAPAVIALISHSNKSATGLRWLPAVLEHVEVRQVPDLEPPANVVERYDPVRERENGPVVAFRDRTTNDIVMTTVEQRSFRCPDCDACVEDVPRGKHRSEEDNDSAEPVTSITYFEKKRRWCAACGGPLWSIAKTEARERKYPHTPFAGWSQAVSQSASQSSATPARITPDGTPGPVCPDSFSPYAYFYRKYRGCAALAIIDESHNGRAEATDIAQAHHFMMLGSQCRVLASGTHTGGELRHLYHYVFRYHPQFWLRLGLGWSDVDAAVMRFGVVQEHITERESDARRGSGAVDRTTSVIEVPGISATLLPHFLSEMVYIGVLDVGAYMPKLVEIPVLIDMDDQRLRERVQQAREALAEAKTALDTARDAEAAAEKITGLQDHLADHEADLEAAEEWADERDLAKHYRRMTDHLETLASQRNNAARLAKGSVPRWWSVLPMIEPHFTVYQKLRGPWGDIIGEQLVLKAPVLTADHVYPLERSVQEIVELERVQGRRVMLFIEQNHERMTSHRYRDILQAHNPWCLPHMDPELREDAIKAAVAGGQEVIIVPYTHVSEGLNLQNELDTVIWVEMAQSHFLRDQASRRIWRLGKQFPVAIQEEHREVRVYYLVYRGTSGHKKLHKLGQQNGAAILFAGDTPDGALVKQAGADHTALAKISRGLDARDDELTEGDLDDTFARRNAERFATLQHGREWIGVVDTLPARLAAVRAEAASVASTITPTMPRVVLQPTIERPKPVEQQRTLFGDDAFIISPRTRRVQPANAQQLTLW